MPKIGSHNAPTVEVELRFDRQYRTYVQQIHGPNRTNATNKAGTVVYEFEASYPKALDKLVKAPDGTGTERTFKVWQLGDGLYTLVQPVVDFSKGGDVKHIAVKAGSVRQTTLDDIRAGFGMAAKGKTKSAVVYSEHNPQALRF